MESGVWGTTILLTGARSPLCQSAARRLGNEGAALGFVDRRVTENEGVCDLLHQFRRSSAALEADLADADSVERAVQEVEERLGPIDFLIHAIGPPDNAAESTEHGLVARNSTAPLAAALTCTRTAMARMNARRHGHIVHLVSGSQIGALEVERLALARLESGCAHAAGPYSVTISAIVFDETVMLPFKTASSTCFRLLESYTGRLVEEEDWAERLDLESGIGDLVLRACTQPGSTVPGRMRAVGSVSDGPRRPLGASASREPA